MSGLESFISSDPVAAWLASAALKGSLLLAAMLLLDLALRRQAAALRHRAWTATFAALLLVPLAAPLVPGWSVPLLPAAIAPASRADLGAAGPTVLDSGSSLRLEAADPAAPPAPAPRRRATPWAVLAVAAWGLGAILLGVQLAIAASRASRLCRRARRLDDPAWDGMLARASQRLGLRVPVRLVQSDAVQMPMAWGIRRHHVVVPAGADRWSEERREVVLLHELAHVRRADCLAHLLSGLVAALYWFHPLVWIARRRQVVERELACDDTVLASGARGADYAWHLLEIARASGSRLSLAPAGVMMARRSQLEGRLLAALDATRDRRGLSRAASAALTAAGLVMVATLAGLQPWATPAVEATEPPAQEPAPEAPPAQVSPTQTPPAQEPPAQQPPAQGRPARERIMQMMIGLLDDPDVSIRKQAVSSLGEMEDAVAVTALAQAAVSDESAGVRSQAAWALGMIESPEGVAVLVPALDDAEREVRSQAAWALGMIESPEAVAGLVVALRQDADPRVRSQAAWALGMIEDEAGLEALIDAVEDENAAVRKQALWAISMIVG